VWILNEEKWRVVEREGVMIKRGWELNIARGVTGAS
jgi:hypothetical protein